MSSADPLALWSHHLAQKHLATLGSMSTSSPPAKELPTLLHLASQVAAPQLPLEVLFDLAVICPPWPAASSEGEVVQDPIRQLFDQHWAEADDERQASLNDFAQSLTEATEGSSSSLKPLLVFAFLRMGGPRAVRAILSSDTLKVRFLLESLSDTYTSAEASLPVRLFGLHAFSLLLGTFADSLSASTLPPLDAVLATLPPPSDDLPKPFTSVWSDVETLFGLSGKVIDIPGWGDIAMRLLQLEGDRSGWEDEALRLELRETVYSSNPINKSESGKCTDPAVLASVDQIQAILPDLSTSFIIAAVAHPYFTAPPPSGAPATSVEERIIEAIFDSAPLPDALNDLLSAPSASLHDSDPSLSAGLTTSDAENEAHLMELARARRQQAEEATGGAVDASQIYHKDTSDVVPPMSDAVPQSVRESIMRLVEVQREEQEEEEREERERQASRRAAAGKVKLDAKQATSRPNEDDDLEEEEHVSARMRGTAAIGADGEASGDDEDEDAARDVSSGPVPIDSDGLLEDLYMYNKKIFNRDGATRRGKERAALKEKTGLSDEQIEGWKIMLERNPRRMASIQARLGMFTPRTNDAPSAEKQDKAPANGNRQQPNGGEGGASRGRGGGRGGRGRGENKGSRGHQNSARKRGNDRKMAMQGPKA